MVFCRGPLRLAPPIYRSISGFRLAAPAPCNAFCYPGLAAHSGLSDSVCGQLAPSASGLLRHPKVTRPGTALLSVASHRLSPVDRPLTSRIQRGDLRRRSLCCDLPAGVPARHLLPVAPLAETVSRFSFVPVSGNEDRNCLLRQDGACNFTFSSRRTHRQARCVSVRFCALPRSRFCFALLLPYTADGFAF